MSSARRGVRVAGEAEQNRLKVYFQDDEEAEDQSVTER